MLMAVPMTQEQAELVKTPILRVRALSGRCRSALANMAWGLGFDGVRLRGKEILLEDVLTMGAHKLLQVKGFGRKSLKELLGFIEKNRFNLAPGPDVNLEESPKRGTKPYKRKYLWIPNQEVKRWEKRMNGKGYTQVLVYAIDGKLTTKYKKRGSF